MVGYKFLALMVGLLLVISIGSVLILAAPSNPISDKDYNSDKYQKIETDYVIFDLPVKATHYWINDGLDKYEVIVHNFSIKDNDDYALRVTWYDDRYVSENLQIHYEFKNGKLSKNDIQLYSLSEYDKSCMDDISLSLSANKYNDCKLQQNKAKLKFQNKNIEIGTIVDYEIKIKKDLNCKLKEGCDLIEVSYPVYSWGTFKDISTKDIPSNFIAVDDVAVSACGTLAVEGETYNLNTSLNVSGSCFIIGADNITINMGGFNITGDDTGNGIDIPDTFTDTIITDGLIYDFDVGIRISDGFNADYSYYNNITNMTIYSSASTGIYLNNMAKYNTFRDINIFNSTDDSIMFRTGSSGQGANYNNFTNININTVFDSAGDGTIISDDSGGNIFVDSEFYTNHTIVIRMSQGSSTSGMDITFINCTYNSSNEAFSGSFSRYIYRRWYLDLTINNSAGNLQNANVISYYSNGSQESSTLTGADGTTRQELTEYINNAGTKTYYTPHTINISKATYTTNSTSQNLSTNVVYYVILGEAIVLPKGTFNINENMGSIGYNIINTSNNGSIIGATWAGDGVNRTMVNGAEYSYGITDGNFVLLNSSLERFGVDILYTYKTYSEYGFHRNILSILTGFIAIIALIFVYGYVKRILDESRID